MSITQLKEQVLKSGLTRDEVRAYGDLRLVETWEKALESKAVVLDVSAELEDCEGKQLEQQPEVAIPSENGYSEIIPFGRKSRHDMAIDEINRQREIFGRGSGRQVGDKVICQVPIFYKENQKYLYLLVLGEIVKVNHETKCCDIWLTGTDNFTFDVPEEKHLKQSNQELFYCLTPEILEELKQAPIESGFFDVFNALDLPPAPPAPPPIEIIVPERMDIPGIPGPKSPRPGDDRRTAIFKNSLHYGEWVGHNCQTCGKSSNCDLSEELANAYISDGMVDQEIGDRIGWQPEFLTNPVLWKCAEAQPACVFCEGLGDVFYHDTQSSKTCPRCLGKGWLDLGDRLSDKIRQDVKQYILALRAKLKDFLLANMLDEEGYLAINSEVEITTYHVERKPYIYDLCQILTYLDKQIERFIPWYLRDDLPARPIWQALAQDHFFILENPEATVTPIAEGYGGAFIPSRIHALGSEIYLWKFPGRVQAENFFHHVTKAGQYFIIPADRGMLCNIN